MPPLGRQQHDKRSLLQPRLHRTAPGSSWLVYTDQVSHAAMAGQHLFEQTFCLPIEAMGDASTSPLRVLEQLLRQKLV